MPFNALLAIDDPNASQLADQSGADGFQMDSTPLFQVSSQTRATLSSVVDRPLPPHLGERRS